MEHLKKEVYTVTKHCLNRYGMKNKYSIIVIINKIKILKIKMCENLLSNEKLEVSMPGESLYV